ncbi:MAG: universal stress protein [Thiotrichales bacterium]|nr:universal stress protein [Thiotrichales bacterium]MCY4284030.1 universal stress protein [Thiotrichales bacterium]
MIKSILVATDASPVANRALDLAIDMAVRYEAGLEIVHVIRDLQIPASLRDMAQVMNMANARGDVMMFVAEQVLSDARERAKAGGVREVATHVGKGDPAGAVIAQARRRKSDLIVIGTRGLSTTEGMLLGSVSRKVANLSRTNCLIVR